MISEPPEYSRMLSTEEVADLLEVSGRTIRRWVIAGTFPQPVRLAGNVVRFRLDVIISWLENQLAAVDCQIDEYCNSPPS